MTEVPDPELENGLLFKSSRIDDRIEEPEIRVDSVDSVEGERLLEPEDYSPRSLPTSKSTSVSDSTVNVSDPSPITDERPEALSAKPGQGSRMADTIRIDASLNRTINKSAILQRRYKEGLIGKKMVRLSLLGPNRNKY